MSKATKSLFSLLDKKYGIGGPGARTYMYIGYLKGIIEVAAEKHPDLADVLLAQARRLEDD